MSFRRMVFAVGIAASIAATPAQAAMNEQMRTEIALLFQSVSAIADADDARLLVVILVEPRYTSEEWQFFFQTRYDPRWYNTSTRDFWVRAIREAGSESLRVAILSGFCAVRAAAAGPVAQAEPALAWLNDIAARLGPRGRGNVFDYMADAYPALGVGNPRFDAFAIQTALTLGVYAADFPAGRQAVARLVAWPEDRRTFWLRSGIMLFDNGALSEGELLSLFELTAVTPQALHRTSAFIVPQSVGIYRPSVRLAVPGQIVYIESIPLQSKISASEFPGTGWPAVPEFTVAAAIELARAIQEVQFAARPELRLRRDALIRHAVARQGFSLRSGNMNRFGTRPDDMLADLAALWLVDGRRAFDLALEKLDAGQPGPMSALLLLCDVLSGGGATTSVFGISTEGHIVRSDLPIGRTTFRTGAALAPVSRPLNAIAINGFNYSFELDSAGVVTAWTRR